MAAAESGSVTDASAANSPVELWSKFPGISDSKLFHEYVSRLSAGRDLKVMITAAAETGVGKTTLAVVLALLWDQHGWTCEKATLDPTEHSVLYDEVNPGSVLILDEAEQAVDKRRAMTNEVRDVGHDFATKRYRQVMGIITAPSKSWLDSRISVDAMDYWIQCQETDQGKPKGEGKVYRLREEEHYESDYSTKTEVISWPPIDWHPEFRRLTEKKVERMEGRTERRYIPRDEVEEMKEGFWQKAWDKRGYELISRLAEQGVQQTEIARAADLSPARISQIANADSFGEAYTRWS